MRFIMNSEILVELRPVEGQKKLRAFANITFDSAHGEITIYGFKVIEKDNGELWVAPPSTGKKDESTGDFRNFNIVKPGARFKAAYEDAILAEYRKQIDRRQP
jgi:DNA-binding cell septation regulator SpoVG